MSGAEKVSHGEQQHHPAPADTPTTNTDAVICYKQADGHISISTPLHFDRRSSMDPAWGAEKDRQNVFIAANILYGYLKSSIQPCEVQTYLLNLAEQARLNGCDSACENTASIRSYLLEISIAFSDDFVACLPEGGGIIPADQIHAWLNRCVSLPDVDESNLTGDELRDCYVSGSDDNVTGLSFDDHGFVCARSVDHDPLFNIPQRIWLRRQLRMDWNGPADACKSLAANVIDRFVQAQPLRAPMRRKINGDVGDFYHPFTEDFIETMPVRGGQIPVSVMSRWFSRHL